jgi:hypothetical protein
MAGGAGPGAYGQFGQVAQQPQVEKKAGPKPPRRGDPFRHLVEDVDEGFQHQFKQQTEEPAMSDQLAALGVQRPQLYQMMLAEKQAVSDVEGAILGATVDPPMRMAGIIHGPRVFGILDVAGQTQIVRPGQTVGLYRVERVERERIVLSRPIGGGKRRQIDVPLQTNPTAQQQVGGPGYPGDPNSGGFPGGGFPGGGFPGGPVGPPSSVR